MTFMVTGAASGLGRYLHEKLGGVAVTRQTPPRSFKATQQPYSSIIHCAFNMHRNVKDTDLNGYLHDTIFLTHELLNIPCKKFIFISSVDVYPSEGVDCSEDMTIDAWALTLSSPYEILKLSCESIIRETSNNFLIIRPSLLMGPYMRANNLTRLVHGDCSRVSLTRESYYNCVLYDDILRFIQYALDNDIQGLFNTVRSGVVTMSQLAEKYSRQVNFGDYDYKPASVSNDKITAICPWFSGTSIEAVEKFARGGK